MDLPSFEILSNEPNISFVSRFLLISRHHSIIYLGKWIYKSLGFCSQKVGITSFYFHPVIKYLRLILVNQNMNKLDKFDFNRTTGIIGLVFLSLGISFLFFSIAYITEAVGWLEAFIEDGDQDFQGISQNWFIGGGISIGVVLISLLLSLFLLRKNMREVEEIASTTKNYFMNLFDFNEWSGILFLCLVPVSFSFFFSGFLYQREAIIWELSAISSGVIWYLREASAWRTDAMIMFIIAIIEISSAAFLLVYNWNLVKNR